MENKTSPSCADELTWQRLADGEVDPDHAELLWHHLSGCAPCRVCMALVQANRRIAGELLGMEDDEAETAGAVTRVQVRLHDRAERPVARFEKVAVITKGRRWTLPETPRIVWPRFATAAAALAAVMFLVLWLPSSDVSATPDFVLRKAGVSARAWTYQPGKVLRWVIENDVRGHPYMPDGRYRTFWWRSNMPGQAGEILRKYDEQNRLTFGRWTKSDGRIAHFSARGVGGVPNRLTIDPSDASLAAVLPSLPMVQQDAVRRYLREEASTRQFLSPAMADRLGDWLVNVAEGQKRNSTIERLTTPEWGDVYYVRTDQRRDGTPWRFESYVTRFTDELYISVTDFRTYRRKTTRYNERGEPAHVEDARYTGFAESTLAEFRSEDLDFDGAMPAEWTVVRQTPEQLAALIARTPKPRPVTTDAPQPSVTKSK